MAYQFFGDFPTEFTLKNIFFVFFSYYFRVGLYFTLLLPMRILVNNKMPQIFVNVFGASIVIFFIIDFGLRPICTLYLVFLFDACFFILSYVYIKPFRTWITYRCNLDVPFSRVIWFYFGNPTSAAFHSMRPVIGVGLAALVTYEIEHVRGYMEFQQTVEPYMALQRKLSPVPLTSTESINLVDAYHTKCINQGFMHRIILKGNITWSTG
jgi:hypothetical protein